MFSTTEDQLFVRRSAGLGLTHTRTRVCGLCVYLQGDIDVRGGGEKDRYAVISDKRDKVL